MKGHGLDPETVKSYYYFCEQATAFMETIKRPEDREGNLHMISLQTLDWLSRTNPHAWAARPFGAETIIVALRETAQLGIESLFGVTEVALGFAHGDLWRRGLIAKAIYDPKLAKQARSLLDRTAFFRELKRRASPSVLDARFNSQEPQRHQQGKERTQLLSLDAFDNMSKFKYIEGSQYQYAATDDQALKVAAELEASRDKHCQRVGADLRRLVERGTASRLLRREFAKANSPVVKTIREAFVRVGAPLGILKGFYAPSGGSAAEDAADLDTTTDSEDSGPGRAGLTPVATFRGVFGQATFIRRRLPGGSIDYGHRYKGRALEELQRISIGHMPIKKL
jgi:hypothetical protein